MSLNKVILMGNLGQDPEIRFTSSQTPVANFSIATTEVRMNDGQRNEFTEWHRIVVWGKQAESCKKFLAKGRTVLIEGRIQTRSWEDKDGNKRYNTEIVAQNVRFVGGNAQRDNTAPQTQFQGQDSGSANDPQPSFGNSGLDNSGDAQIPSLDQIPF